MNSSFWERHPEALSELVELWRDRSAGWIADYYTKKYGEPTTRNAVIGKIVRFFKIKKNRKSTKGTPVSVFQNINRTPQPRKAACVRHTETTSLPAPVRDFPNIPSLWLTLEQLPDVPSPWLTLKQLPNIPSLWLTLEQLPDNGCRYIKDSENGALYCSLPTMLDKSYCSGHHQVVYIKIARRSSDPRAIPKIR
jgi:hypothetical protein